jgi:hypothetical protein
VFIQGYQKVSVHLTITVLSSGAQRLFDSPVYIMCVVLQSVFVVKYIDTGISSPSSSSSSSSPPLSSRDVSDPVQDYFGFPSQCSDFFLLV